MLYGLGLLHSDITINTETFNVDLNVNSFTIFLIKMTRETYFLVKWTVMQWGMAVIQKYNLHIPRLTNRITLFIITLDIFQKYIYCKWSCLYLLSVMDGGSKITVDCCHGVFYIWSVLITPQVFSSARFIFCIYLLLLLLILFTVASISSFICRQISSTCNYISLFKYSPIRANCVVSDVRRLLSREERNGIREFWSRNAAINTVNHSHKNVHLHFIITKSRR